MSAPTPEGSQVRITPREFLKVVSFGTGEDLRRKELAAYMGEKGAIVRGTREMIQNLTGFTPKELHKKANDRNAIHSHENEQIQAKIRTQIVRNLPFLQKYKEGHEAVGLQELGQAANDYINHIIGDFFPADRYAQMHNEVSSCDDPATLILMAFNDELAEKIKFEAARKLALMQILGKIKDHGRERGDALQYMMGVFNDRILKLPEGIRKGSTIDRYLVTEHADDDFSTTSTSILEEEPEGNGNPLKKITHLPSRRALVKDKSGTEREIFFSLESREKTNEARLTKALRYGGSVGEREMDRNGFQLVFETIEDWNDFYPMLQEEIKNEIRRGITARLEAEENEEIKAELRSRLSNLDKSIVIHDEKGSLNGGSFNGNDKSSSRDLKVFKFKMIVLSADEKQHQYEFQIFLPGGFSDSKYRTGVSWGEYHVNRFFEAEVDKLLFPKSVYPDLNHKKAHKKAIERARAKVWNGQSH